MSYQVIQIQPLTGYRIAARSGEPGAEKCTSEHLLSVVYYQDETGKLKVRPVTVADMATGEIDLSKNCELFDGSYTVRKIVENGEMYTKILTKTLPEHEGPKELPDVCQTVDLGPQN